MTRKLSALGFLIVFGFGYWLFLSSFSWFANDPVPFFASMIGSSLIMIFSLLNSYLAFAIEKLKDKIRLKVKK